MSNEQIENNETAEQAIPRGYWQDAKGNLTPVSRIKEIDKVRHKLVVDLAERARGMSDTLADFKLEVMSELAAFVQRSADEYEVVMRGAVGKGNITLTSYDGRYKIVRQLQDRLAFDERLQIAKALSDECLHLWSKGANPNLKVIVNQAFQVDQEGKVSIGKILSLRTYKIDDPKWKQMLAAIADSMRVIGSKPYVRFYERNAAGEYVAIVTDLAGA